VTLEHNHCGVVTHEAKLKPKKFAVFVLFGQNSWFFQMPVMQVAWHHSSCDADET
jgi:hypothetical protein